MTGKAEKESHRPKKTPVGEFGVLGERRRIKKRSVLRLSRHHLLTVPAMPQVRRDSVIRFPWNSPRRAIISSWSSSVCLGRLEETKAPHGRSDAVLIWVSITGKKRLRKSLTEGCCQIVMPPPGNRTRHPSCGKGKQYAAMELPKAGHGSGEVRVESPFSGRLPRVGVKRPRPGSWWASPAGAVVCRQRAGFRAK